MEKRREEKESGGYKDLMRYLFTLILFFFLISTYCLSKEIVVEATAYTHTGNPCATGIYPYKGVIAVDPNVIPLYSEVYVEGYGYAIALDTGRLIKGYKIDLFFNTYDECIKFGVRKLKIKILKKGK